MKLKKKRALTLIEIMIVIVLIGLIGSVIGVNMKGSLDAGKAFKTRQAKEQIADILQLEIARGASMDEVMKDPKKYLEESGMVKKPDELLKDGWGVPFEIRPENGDILVISQTLINYDAKKK